MGSVGRCCCSLSTRPGIRSTLENENFCGDIIGNLYRGGRFRGEDGCSESILPCRKQLLLYKYIGTRIEWKRCQYTVPGQPDTQLH